MTLRKHDSGCSKRKKKRRVQELIQSQRGSLNKFFTKKVNSENSNGDTNTASTNDNIANADSVDNIDANIDGIGDAHDIVVDCDANNPDLVETENYDVAGASNRIDMFDPRIWDSLDSKMIDILIVKGPRRDSSILKGPKDKFSKRFSTTCYNRVLSNRESRDRDWLVYSKELDRLFCFCCKIFNKRERRGQLSNEGFSDWSHLNLRLKEHEKSFEHIKNMATWYDLRLRLQKNQTIDKVAQKQIEKEKNHWKRVLVRSISVVKFLAKHNIAFRGSNEKLYQSNNGNFLGLIEMLAEFDSVTQEHVHRIVNDEIHFHYLGHKIQNEIILLLASTIKSEIIRKIKQAKYFSVILVCTPDISHQEQKSMILRYVDVSSNSVSIEESFLGFLEVNDTTGLGLFGVLKAELISLDLDIDDVRGQSYDNGSNMKGEHSGVQKRLLDINPRAFHTSCAAHSLNLTLCDIANSCGKARDFFGIVQRIYTIFANSNKRWKILKDNVTDLTVKPLSSTRWESHVESVKAIRCQILELREALLQVADTDNDSKIRSEAKSLAEKELGEFEFILSLVIWYEILFAIERVSKKLQSKDILIDNAILLVKGLLSFFQGYRETGFENALKEAKKIAIKLEVDSDFPEKRVIRRKRQLDEVSNAKSPEASKCRKELFKTDYFLYLMDKAIPSLETRFQQYDEFEFIFGFLFSSKKLYSLDDNCLKSSCMHVEYVLKNEKQSDIDGYDLYLELKLLQDFLHEGFLQPLDALNFLKRVDCFPNATIVYRILLTIPITVATAERSFSKLKLLKSYLRSTMTQERLNGLAMVAIENDLLEKTNIEELIENFVSNNARRILLFK